MYNKQFNHKAKSQWKCMIQPIIHIKTTNLHKRNHNLLLKNSKIYNILFLTVQNRCLSNNPCRHGGVCEEVEDNYQYNCSDTDYLGPICETGMKYNKI